MISNSGSIGAVTLTVANATAESLWGNSSGSSGVPSYLTSPTISGTMTANAFTSTMATGTAPFTVSSTTNVANLNASSLNGATFAVPGTIGGTTAAAGYFTTLNANGAITDTQSIGSTSTDGLVLTNTTAATSSNQQWSPRIHFAGQGWKTTATAASRTVDMCSSLETGPGIMRKFL